MPKWNGGVIGVANNPTISSAKGIWSLSEATKAIRAGLWPPSNAGADPYFENVTMLLSADGTNGAQNNTFLDSSTNNFTITRNGNTTQGTFTPFSKYDGAWGVYFDGTGDYLSVPRSTDFLPGANVDFTFEVWFYPTATPGGATNVVGLGEFGTNADWHMGVNSSLQLTFYLQSTTTTYTNSTQALTLNQWNHLAISRSGTGSNNLKLFVNGVSQSFSVNNTLVGTGTNPLTIGADNGGDEGNITGYLSNLRLVNGQGLYTANFTPTTSPLTTTSQSVTASNVELLALQSNRFIDNSSNAATITRNGDVSIQTFSPFPTLTAYASGTNGGSGYSDGSGDYLTVASNANLTLGSSDFTIELWWYPLAFNSDSEIFTMAGSGGTSRCFAIYSNASNGTLLAFAGTGSTSWDIVSSLSMGTAVKNAWNHIAFTRSGSTFSGYLNGSRIATTTATGTLGSSGLGIFANNAGTSQAPNSYISGARMVKGTALYTDSTYTIPTAPPTAVTNTNLLLNFTNGGIIDAAMSNDLETVGNAQISTTQSKFGGSSMYFDGNGDYLFVPNTNLSFNFGTGDFTVEGWIYLSATPSTSGTIIDTRSSDALSEYHISVTTSNKLDFIYSSSRVTSATSISNTTWTHIAITRSSGTIRLFINGSLDANTASYSGGINAAATPAIGGGRSGGTSAISGYYFNGYIDDLRITKGYARYTASFTAPTAAFNGFGD
jgi:hypothetical protein